MQDLSTSKSSRFFPITTFLFLRSNERCVADETMNKRLARWMLALTGVSAWAALPHPIVQEANSKPAPEDIPAVRMIADPYPAFNGIAVDATNGIVVTSDPNRKSLLLYSRTSGASAGAASIPMRQIIGPETFLGMV